MRLAFNTTGESLRAFIQYRRAPGEGLFAVVDAARNRELIRVARDRLGLQTQCLFDGESAKIMEGVAPYVVSLDRKRALDRDSREFIDMYAERLGSSAAVMLFADVEADKVAVHLKKVFRAADETGRKYYFRFYDPRVLRPFIEVCEAGDATQFFGPIRRWIVESESPGKMWLYSSSASGVSADEVEIDAQQAVPKPRNRYRR